MFLAAVVQGPGFSVPVRIRNMSTTGALVEAAAVPEDGSSVRLIRGSLTIPAQVMWSEASRCGLRFSSVVSVREWLAPPSNGEQKRVDDALRAMKAGAIPLPLKPESHDAASPIELGMDLRAVTKLLGAHCEDLLGDPHAVIRYGERLQNLDIVLQVIGAVADMLSGAGEESSIASRLQNLRASARQAIEREA